MKGTEFANYIRKKTGTDATSLPDADIVAYANPVKDTIAAELEKRDEKEFATSATQNITVSTRDYTIPSTWMNQILRVEAKLDGTNWQLLQEIDFNLIDFPITETDIQYQWADKDPAYYKLAGKIYILSGTAIAAVTNGLKIFTEDFPVDIEAATLALTTQLTMLPRQLHRVWADGIVIEWKSAADRQKTLTDYEVNWFKYLGLALDALSKRTANRSIVASVPEDTGEDY